MKAQRKSHAEDTRISDGGFTDDVGQVLVELRAALEDVRNEYGELPHRETAWRKLQRLVADRLWAAVDQPGEGRLRQQLADQLDAAVTNLDALQLTAEHLTVIDTMLDRLADPGASSSDVHELEAAWRRVGVDTLPSFGEFLKQWMELSRPVADGLG